MKLLHKKVATPTRRQRLGGSANTPANFSYHSRRSSTSGNTGRNIGRAAFKPVIRVFGSFWLQRFGIFLLLIAGTVILINSAFLSATPKVVLLQPANAALLHESSVYQKAANKLFVESFFNRSKITANTGHISSELMKQFPEVGSATVTLPLLSHTPVIYIVPVRPALILSTSTGSFVIDTGGKALLPSAGLTAAGHNSLPMVIDQSGIKVEAGTQVLPSSDVTFIQMVVAQLANRKFAIASLTLPAASQELDARLTDKPFYIKFNLAAPDTARTQAGTFLAVFTKLQSQNSIPSQYIDVRVPGRAYYK